MITRPVPTCSATVARPAALVNSQSASRARGTTKTAAEGGEAAGDAAEGASITVTWYAGAAAPTGRVRAVVRPGCRAAYGSASAAAAEEEGGAGAGGAWWTPSPAARAAFSAATTAATPASWSALGEVMEATTRHATGGRGEAGDAAPAPPSARRAITTSGCRGAPAMSGDGGGASMATVHPGPRNAASRAARTWGWASVTQA
jgi:hypothetical protein